MDAYHTMAASTNSRRNFVKRTALAAVAATGLSNMQLLAASDTAMPVKESNLTILFQGDSITDGNRGRDKDPNHIMGHGYAFSIASRVGAAFPAKNNLFYNRGISGNKITDLALRWQTDTLELQPDVLSILVGINDTNAVVNQQDIVSPQQYETVLRSLLQQTLAKFPDCLLVLCEPFILPVGRVKENWNAWHDDILQRQAIVKTVAKEFNAVFVPLQQTFTDACNKAAPDYWIWDGVHPTVAGHELMARKWINEVQKRISF